MWNIAVFLAIISYTFAQKAAVVYLYDPSGTTTVTGNVTFTRGDDGISIKGTVTGLKPGAHGFHIHSLGDLSGGCASTGVHFNPHNVTHGGPNDTIRHVGDLGNVKAENDGIATINFVDTVIDLNGDHSIIGRSLVVHELEDDLGKLDNDGSKTTGNAGGRVACGVVGILDDQDSSGSRLAISYLSVVIGSVVAFGFRLLL